MVGSCEELRSHTHPSASLILLKEVEQSVCSLSSELVLGLFLGISLLSLDLDFGLLLVELHELGEIELGLLEKLDLSNEDVLEGEDLLALLGDLLAEGVLDAISMERLYKYLMIQGSMTPYYLGICKEKMWIVHLQLLGKLLEG